MSKDEMLWDYLSGLLTDNRKALFEKVLSLRTRHITVAVEDTFQEQNASAILRTCDCCGIQDIHIIEGRNEYKVSKNITQGSEKWLDLNLYNETDTEENINTCISSLKKEGYRIVATVPSDNSSTLEEYDTSVKSALFFGREKEGLSKEILDQADHHLKIPMVGFTESFNISVSAAIILYTLTSRLRSSSYVNWQLSEKESLEKKIEWAIKTIPNAEKIVARYFENVDR